MLGHPRSGCSFLWSNRVSSVETRCDPKEQGIRAALFMMATSTLRFVGKIRTEGLSTGAASQDSLAVNFSCSFFHMPLFMSLNSPRVSVERIILYSSRDRPLKLVSLGRGYWSQGAERKREGRGEKISSAAQPETCQS